MINYKDLGLSNTADMFKKAMDGGYAIPALNFNNMEQLQAIIQAATESRSPVIIQLSKGAMSYISDSFIPHLAKAAVQYSSDLSNGNPVPIALHLDHGDSLETVKRAISVGFSSVMIDASHYDYDENVRISKEVAEFAHPLDITVEAELGVLAGIEDDVVAEKSHYTNPEEVEDFVKKTGVDSLAISIGTSHGAYKFKPAPGEEIPPLHFDILEGCQSRLPGFPIVLHGASSIPVEAVKLLNQYGGKMDNAAGVPADQVRKAASMAVCKVNIDSDGRLTMTGRIREVFHNKPSEFDPRKYLGPAREDLVELYKDKMKNLLGSAGRC